MRWKPAGSDAAMHSIKNAAWVFLYGMLRIGCILRWPLLAAVIWRVSLVRFPGIKKPPSVRGRVIVLNKIGGMDDLLAAYRNHEAEFDFFLLRRKLITIIFSHFLDDEVKHYSYLSDDPDIERRKQEYRTYLKLVLLNLNRLWPFSAAISFNIAYAAERELASAMSEIGLPFIVCHKECIKTEAQHQIYSAAYRARVGSFGGACIGVYNEEERESMLRADLAASEQVTVIGCARVDLAHETRKIPSQLESERTVLCYTIFEQAGLPYLDKEWVAEGQDWYQGPPLSWSKLAFQTNKCLVEFARTNPDIRVIFKAKQGNEARSRAMLGEAFPENVEFIAGGTGTQLLQTAKVVVAFNSAALFESIAAGRRVVMPTFGMDRIPNRHRFIYQVDGVVTEAHTSEEMRMVLLKLLYETPSVLPLSEAASDVLDRYVGNSDGSAGARLRQFLHEAILTPCSNRGGYANEIPIKLPLEH